MGAFSRYFPFTDIKVYTAKAAAQDLMAAVANTFMAVPQGVAYAVIAGLPPVMGLYAAAIPNIVGSLMRSSRHVVTGPTNAVSLLVGGGIATMIGFDPMLVAVTLAFMVGFFQFTAGVLRLGALVDYISNPVVLGYITGAGLLIGIGQLPNITGTVGGVGTVIDKIGVWLEGLGASNPTTIIMALSTAALILVLRRIDRRIPGPILALGGATIVSYMLNLPTRGIRVLGDLAPVPSGLPAFTLPDWTLAERLMPLAVAVTVLSLVEASSVARSIAAKSGQRVDTSVEFSGQGLANMVAGFCGAYPTSGSLARSALNYSLGAKTRLSGVFAGFLMLIVLLFLGPVVDQTPIAALAGLLIVVAMGLVDLARIRVTLAAPWGDRLAFVATLIGTWFLPLDKAIYLGVGISIVLFLRKARLLVIHELGVDKNNRLRDVHQSAEGEFDTCDAIRILHVEGNLFFGAVGELQDALDEVIADQRVLVVVLRLKRTQGMDVSVAMTLEAAAIRLQEQNRLLVLAGVRPEVVKVLQQTKIADVIGQEAIFPTEAKWFKSLRAAVKFAQARVGEERVCERCPLHNMKTPDRLEDSIVDP